MCDKLEVGKIGYKGKIIRDSVHGDIFVPEKFLEIIDTPEFQRLRRIKQLSVADTVFPSADHTRLSHSLGTFYIMGLMINHFVKILQEMNISVKEEDKDIALLAALLHDVGHGPFSHAFEGIHPNKENNISHEDWTIKIITEASSFINQKIIANFGENAPTKTADLIRKQRNIGQDENFVLKDIDLFSILSSLVSSQLDSDRLDYLLRDSISAGVTFGKIDISRIISSLQITVYDNKYFVCVYEKFLQDIEAYLLARYQMNKVVYYHDFKIQMEQLIKLIFGKAHELFLSGNLEFCPPAIKTFFNDDNLSVADYVNLDDSTFICAFHEWTFSSNNTLSELCKSFLNREKSKKINALDNSDMILSKFKQEVCALFEKHQYHIEDLKNEYFWIESVTDFSAYKPQKENIWILRNNGIMVDISEASDIIREPVDKQPIWQDDRNVVFINYNILRTISINNVENLVSELKTLISNYDIRKTIEIEKKYHFEDSSVFKKVDEYFEKQKVYTINKGKSKEQIDTYYDTVNYDLKNSNSTLRIRQKGNEFEITIKKPILSRTESNDQNTRFEFQKKISDNNLANNSDFVFEYLDFLDRGTTFIPSLIVKNSRTPINLTNNNISFEMVFDSVVYEISNKKSIKDYQIEIELKSDYSHRVNLKILTDDIEKQVVSLISSKTSKYFRGLQLLDKE